MALCDFRRASFIPLPKYMKEGLKIVQNLLGTMLKKKRKERKRYGAAERNASIYGTRCINTMREHFELGVQQITFAGKYE